MGRYQIFNTVDTGIHSDDINTREQYQRVPCMRAPHCACVKPMFSHAKEKKSVMPFGGDSGGDTCEVGSSSQIASIRYGLWHVNTFLFLTRTLSSLSGCMHVYVYVVNMLSCIDASHCIEYQYQKKHHINNIKGKILSIVMNWKYLVSPTPGQWISYSTFIPNSRKSVKTDNSTVAVQ